MQRIACHGTHEGESPASGRPAGRWSCPASRSAGPGQTGELAGHWPSADGPGRDAPALGASRIQPDCS